MTTPPILHKLDFSDIKTSLTDYLKKQTIFEGYEFEGSVMQTLIDLLAYNTYYYAFYSNMMSNEVFLDSAQRITSLVSLVKPLGYTVPGKKSASASIQTTLNVAAYTAFNGVLPDGRYYTFYNENAAVANTNFEIIEANRVVVERDITDLFDFTSQRFILDEPDVDISTIRVEIKTNDTWVEWKNVNYFPNSEEEIFYIDRYGDIFVIQLGKSNNLGKSIVSGTHKIGITYLISSGSVANNIFSFSGTGVGIISLVETSHGGGNGPDIDLIKFTAPKSFSAQDRAVTKNDYYGLLLKNNIFDDINTFAIFGGEEIFPPKYGRVFVSFKETTDITAKEVLDFLRNKNVLTVLPEYVTPTNMSTLASVQFTFLRSLSEPQRDQLYSEIVDVFNSNYGNVISRFGVSFDFDAFKLEVMSLFGDKGLKDLSLNDIKYSTTLSASKSSHEIAIQNRITDGAIAITPSFISIYNDKQLIIKLPAKPLNVSNIISTLDVYEIAFNGVLVKNSDINAGTVHWNAGVIQLRTIWKTDLTFTVPVSSSVISPITNALTTLSIT